MLRFDGNFSSEKINESKSKYRSIRFNMYSKDTLSLLNNLNSIKLNDNIIVYGEAIPKFNL